MPKELTGKQIERQDCVDNAIYECVNNLVTDDMRKILFGLKRKLKPEERNLEWDMNWIGEVREAISGALISYYNVDVDMQDRVIMDFYPYIEE